MSQVTVMMTVIVKSLSDSVLQFHYTDELAVHTGLRSGKDRWHNDSNLVIYMKLHFRHAVLK